MAKKMKHPKTTVKRSKFGKGVYAARAIRKGEIVAVFDGEIYDENFEQWTADLLNHTIQFAKGLWRDSKGSARWINHSCEPNCGIKDFFKVVAMRSIAAGEEITWDYEMTEKSDWWRMKCRCGSAECRGLIGNYSRMPSRVRRKYKGFISTWLLGARANAKLEARLRRPRT